MLPRRVGSTHMTFAFRVTSASRTSLPSRSEHRRFQPPTQCFQMRISLCLVHRIGLDMIPKGGVIREKIRRPCMENPKRCTKAYIMVCEAEMPFLSLIGAAAAVAAAGCCRRRRNGPSFHPNDNDGAARKCSRIAMCVEST